MVLIKRNVKLFFRDKTAVFFSLLAVLIIIGLYAVFLGDVMLKDPDMAKLPNAKMIMYEWLFAGLLTVTSVTASMGAFSIMVEDKSKKIIRDFNCAPISGAKITFGYIGSAFVVGTLVTTFTLLLAEIFIVMQGGELLSPFNLLKTFLLLLLSVLASSALVTFLVGIFKTQSQFSGASTIIGTLIGFITGIYLPVGNLPDYAQVAVKCFPLSHSAALFRGLLMDDSIDNAFAGAGFFVHRFKIVDSTHLSTHDLAAIIKYDTESVGF
ncbi:ABC transporter [Clostridia bacterium]|nr:ABC transporter [Clostridia bacterium]